MAILLVALGFGAGLLAGLASFPGSWLVAPCAALSAPLFLRRSIRAVVLLTAIAAGSVWGTSSRIAHDRDCRTRWRSGDRLTLILEHRSLVADGRMQRMQIGEGPCQGAVTVMMPPALAGEAGRYLANGRWMRELDPSVRRWRRAARQGRFIVREARRIGAVRCPSAACFRIAAERRLARLYGRQAPLASAFTVNAEAAISREERDRYAQAGLAHLLSISGFHVALIAASLVVVLRAARVPQGRAHVAAALASALYVLFLGAPAPALRAGLALALWTWSRRRQRPTSPAALIASCAVAVMIADPFALLEPGPWLSFAGVWGCVSASRLWSRVVSDASRRRRAQARLLGPVAISVGATVATSPLTILIFGVATPVAIVSNLAAVPLAAFAVPAIGLSLVLSLLPWALPAGTAAAAAGASLELLEHSAKLTGRLPGGNLQLAGGLAAAAGGLIAWVLLRPLPHRSRRPAARLLCGRGVLAALVALAATQSLAFAAPRSSDAEGRLALHFLAVGQGDATVIRTPRGRWILVDGGPRTGGMDAGQRRVVPFLRRHGVERLDLVVASHGDADHLGGLPTVLRAVPASLVVEPGEALPRALYRRWLAQTAKSGARWHAARAGERFVVDGVTLRVWHPDSAWMTRGSGANENSLVLTVEYGAFRALLPGDAGLPMEALRGPAIGDVALLKVGHHGSRSATGRAWLAAVAPEVCIIPVGVNRYGHPHPAVLAALRDARCRVLRTDRDGDIRVLAHGRDASMIVEESP